MLNSENGFTNRGTENLLGTAAWQGRQYRRRWIFVHREKKSTAGPAGCKPSMAADENIIWAARFRDIRLAPQKSFDNRLCRLSLSKKSGERRTLSKPLSKPLCIWPSFDEDGDKGPESELLGQAPDTGRLKARRQLLQYSRDASKDFCGAASAAAGSRFDSNPSRPPWQRGRVLLVFVMLGAPQR